MNIVGIDPSINSTGLFKIELDDDMKVVNQDYMGFTQVKKNSSDKIHHYKKNQFIFPIEQNIWMYNKILSFVGDCKYVAIEDYAFHSTGRSVFQIGEFVGGLKQMLFKEKKFIRLYEPTVIKMYATGKGTADKVRMCDTYDNSSCIIKDIIDLPQYKQPKEDLVDAFYICSLLRKEMELRKGITLLKDLNLEEIKIFNRVTKAYPVNILARNFIGEYV